MIFTVEASRAFARAPEDVFAAWTDPALRAAFETPEGSGMRYEGFDTREGGTETVLIETDGAEMGRMIQEIRVLRPPSGGAPGLLVAQGRGVFGGVPGLFMQTSVEVAAEDGGARLTGRSQICAPSGQPDRAQVEAGWEAMLDRFAAALQGETT